MQVLPDPHFPTLLPLLSGLKGVLKRPACDARLSGIRLDSRLVQPGDLFVAITGGTTDGHRFIRDALQRGAAAVVGEQPISDLPVPYLQVEDSRDALAQLAAGFYGNPAHQLVMIGVTGTDGKTTTSNLIYHILQAAGLNVGMISTVNALIGEKTLDTGFHVTTPESPDVQRYLALMIAAGLTHVVLEATSQGLVQKRVDACEFDLGVVTNITHEHLDYHGSYAAYRAAKGLLFESLVETPPKPQNPPRCAILNRDDSSYDYLATITRTAQLSYGRSDQADVIAREIELRSDGIRFTAVGHDLDGTPFGIPLTSPFVGEFNLYNCLAAVTLGRGALKLDAEIIQRGVEAMQAVPGRMERIDLGQDFGAMVDFAHTPNALRRALEAARQLTNGRVIAVFGSAGLRDKAKRRMMAQVSAELADLTVLTAEDPRTESLAGILEEMARGALEKHAVEGQTFWRVPDRRDAIRFAVELAHPGDLLIVCGKGHEQSMCFGEVEYPWDDRVALRAALADRLAIAGPQMPELPKVE